MRRRPRAEEHDEVKLDWLLDQVLEDAEIECLAEPSAEQWPEIALHNAVATSLTATSLGSRRKAEELLHIAITRLLRQRLICSARRGMTIDELDAAEVRRREWAAVTREVRAGPPADD